MGGLLIAISVPIIIGIFYVSGTIYYKEYLKQFNLPCIFKLSTAESIFKGFICVSSGVGSLFFVGLFSAAFIYFYGFARAIYPLIREDAIFFLVFFFIFVYGGVATILYFLRNLLINVSESNARNQAKSDKLNYDIQLKNDHQAGHLFLFKDGTKSLRGFQIVSCNNFIAIYSLESCEVCHISDVRKIDC